MFRTLFVYAFIILYTLIVGPPLLLASAITGDTKTLYAAGLLGARAAFRLAGVRVIVTGRGKIPAGRAVVFMPDHQSNCDPPALAANLPPLRFMAKKEFFRVPILGTGMRMLGFIPVDRANREQAFAAVDQAITALKDGHSFLVFPEGTRSSTGRLQPFKKGVFVMAIKAGAPIVPVSVSGGSQILRKGNFRIHPGQVRITLHDPVPTENCSIADRAKVMRQVRSAITSGLSPDERPIEPEAV